MPYTENQHKKYIVTSQLNFTDYNKKMHILEKDTLLICNNPKTTGPWRFEDDSGTILYIPEELVKSHIKNFLEVYQEQYSHLDKNNRYFGQVNFDTNFSIEENGITRYYRKIGEYMTSEGIKYNTVEGNNINVYFDATEIEHYKKVKFTYFNNEDIVEKNYQFGQYEVTDFYPMESIKVCEYMREYRYMLEIIECFFSKIPLPKPLYEYYEKYQQAASNDIEEGNGFIVHANKPFDEIKKDIIHDIKNDSGYQRLYYIDYLLKKNINNPEFDKEKVLKDIAKDGYVLIWCNEEMRKDRDIVLAALKENKHMLCVAGKDIRSLIGEGSEHPDKDLEIAILNEKIDSIVPQKEEKVKKKLKI